MPPVRMTKAEYQTKYGVAPVATSATLDNDPIPLRMTRAEYNAQYNPKKETGFKADVKSTIEGISSTLEQGKQDRQRIRTEVETGQTSPEMGTFKTLGKGLSTGFSTIFQGAVGAAKAILPQGVQEKIGGAVESTVKGIEGYNQRFVEDLKTSEDPKDRETGQKIEETVNLYKTDQSFRDTVDATGGILEAVTSVVGIGPTKKALTKTADVVSDTVGDIKDVTKTLKQDFNIARNDTRVSKVVDEISGIENKYVVTRRKADIEPNVLESRTRIAQSNVLQNAIDEDGLIRTKVKGGALDEYRANTIDGKEDIVRRNLETEGRSVNLNEVKADIYDAVMKSGLESGDLALAIKRIDNDLKGLALRANEFGNVPLVKLQDAKTSIYKHIDYTKPSGVTYRKTLARVYKETIENKSNLPVKEWNQELGKFYNDLDRLADLDGKLAKGGRLGKYTASLAGSAVGGLAGSVAGAPGAVVGGLVGGEVSSLLKGKAMAKTFTKGVDGKFPKSQILDEATARVGVKDLRTPDIQVGVSKAIMSNPDLPKEVKAQIAKIEGQIKDNIKQQKTAIKAGDFTLVEAQKAVYKVLVERLKEVVRTSKDYRNTDLMSSQKKAIKAPITAQNISANIAKKSDKTIKLSPTDRNYLPDELEQKKLEISIAEEALNADPAKELMRYISKRGDSKGTLGEVTGKQGSKTGIGVDSRIADLGFSDSETARKALDKYRADVEDLKQRKADLKEEIASYRAEFKSLEDVAYQAQNEVSDFFETESFMDKVKKTFKDQTGAIKNPLGKGETDLQKLARLNESSAKINRLKPEALGVMEEYVDYVEAVHEVPKRDIRDLKDAVIVIAKELDLEVNRDLANEFRKILDARQNPKTRTAKMLEVKTNTDIPATNKLVEEAKKYKSVDEFVERQMARGDGMQHRPTFTKATAADVSQKASDFGLPDFYKNPQEYRTGNAKADDETIQALLKVRNKPDAEVTIYRASPKNELRDGDWVTLSKEYARGESLAEGTKVHSFTVKAKDIHFAGDSINEFGYFPSAKVDELSEVWKKATRGGADVEDAYLTFLKKNTDKYKTVDEWVNAMKASGRTRTQLEDIWKQANQK